jgi:ABC-type antimicrobial peptide transport system, permease component
VLEVPATVVAGEYTAELTLTGLDADYPEAGFSRGGAFPDDTAMPYIVLNEAACKQFRAEKNPNSWQGEPEDDLPGIDWLSERFSVRMGEGTKAVTAKVCGVLAKDGEEDGREQQPAAYISVASAKALLQGFGQSADYTAIKARLRNIGCVQRVSKAVAALALTVSNSTGELQAAWDTETEEMAYLIVTGGFCLICSAALLIAWRKISLLEQKEAWRALEWLGMKRRELRALFAAQALALSLSGIAVGIIVSLSLPSFLSSDMGGSSIFLLQAPFAAAAISALICVAAGVLPVLFVSTAK